MRLSAVLLAALTVALVPVSGVQLPVTVTVGLSISDVHYDIAINYDELRPVTDTAVVTGWLSTEWVDESLAWTDNSTAARQRPLTPGADTWMPDIRHLNTVGLSSSNLLLSSTDSNGVVYPTGRVHYETPIGLTVRYIPKYFVQVFEIRLGSRLMTKDQMVLEPASDTLDVSEYTGWYLKNTWLEKNETTRAGFTEPFALLVAGIFPTVF